VNNIFQIDKPHWGTEALKSYFRLKTIATGLLTALLLSLFIYLDYFGFRHEVGVAVITSLSALAGFYLLLTQKREVLFWSGFFTGILWFYWISFSFRYYGVGYLMPLMILFVALGYATFFWIIGLFRHPLIRALLLLGFGYFHPMSFNWFIPELTLIHSFFGIQKWQFALFLLALVIAAVVPAKYRIAALLPLALSVNTAFGKHLPLPETKIMLIP